MNNILLPALVVLLLAASSARSADWSELSGEDSGVVSRNEAVVRTPAEWTVLWAEHDAGKGRPLPEVDFTKDMVTAAWSEPGRRFVMRKVSASAPSALGPAAPRGENEALRGLKEIPELSGTAFDGAAGGKKGGDWALVLRFGPTFTDYARTDIQVQTGRVQGVIKNAEIGERNDMGWYRLKNIKARPFHFIDEPSNDFTIGVENRRKGWAVNLTARHPKFTVVEEGTINQNVRFAGTVDGAAVDRDLRANELFDHYRLTHNLMNYQLQVEKLFTVAEGKAGRLVVAPGLAVGAYFGYANAGYAGSTESTPPSNGYLGKGFSASGRVSYEFHRISASVAYQLTKAVMNYPLLDGSAGQRLDNRAVTFQVGIALKK